LLARGMEQAKKYGAQFVLGTVQTIKKNETGFAVSTKSQEYQSRYVIVATGIDDVTPDIDNIYEFMGETFFHCFDCDGYHMKDKNVGIIGKGDGVARTALAARQMYTERITIFTGTDNKISEAYRQKLAENGTKIIAKNIKHLNGRDGKLESIALEDGAVVEIEMILTDLGYTRNDAFLEGLGLARSETGYIKTDAHYESSVPGVFVIGPLNTGPDQVSVAVGSGAQAAMHVIEADFKF